MNLHGDIPSILSVPISFLLVSSQNLAASNTCQAFSPRPPRRGAAAASFVLFSFGHDGSVPLSYFVLHWVECHSRAFTVNQYDPQHVGKKL